MILMIQPKPRGRLHFSRIVSPKIEPSASTVSGGKNLRSTVRLLVLAQLRGFQPNLDGLSKVVLPMEDVER